MSDTRYGQFTVMSQCPHCGQPLPLSGPAQHVSCGHCLEDVRIPDGVWPPILEAYDNDHESIGDGPRQAATVVVQGLRVRYEYGAGVPQCEKCATRYAADHIEVGDLGDVACTNCGDPGSTYPIPSWLIRAVPSARQVFSVNPGQGRPSDGVALQAPLVAKPIAMACPNCAGGLTVTAESTRLLPCAFCHTDVYLPDEIWRRLHPVKRVQPFFVRFDGPSRAQQERAEKAQRQAKERVRDQRHRQFEQEKLRVKREAIRMKQARAATKVRAMTNRAWIPVGVSGVLLALFAAWCWVIRVTTGAGALSGPWYTITVGLGITTAIAVFVSMGFANRPIKEKLDDFSVTWFWVPFSFIPVLGALFALVRVYVFLVRAKTFSSSSTSNTTTSYTAGVAFEYGESRPAGFLFLCLTLFWQLAVVALIE